MRDRQKNDAELGAATTARACSDICSLPYLPQHGHSTVGLGRHVVVLGPLVAALHASRLVVAALAGHEHNVACRPRPGTCQDDSELRWRFCCLRLRPGRAEHALARQEWLWFTQQFASGQHAVFCKVWLTFGHFVQPEVPQNPAGQQLAQSLTGRAKQAG